MKEKKIYNDFYFNYYFEGKFSSNDEEKNFVNKMMQDVERRKLNFEEKIKLKIEKENEEVEVTFLLIFK